MTKINAYLSFHGNCREAMTFYKECLGGELVMQPIEGSPVADQMPAEARNGVLHSTLTNGGLVLLASDMGCAEDGVMGNRVSLMVDCSSAEEINTLFSALSSGGTVRCALGVQFWGATFGALTDRFGINWQLNYDQGSK